MIIVAIIIFSVLCLIIYLSYDGYKYADGIKKETKKTFEKNKDFIYKLSFQGQVIEKVFCEKCIVNRYTLKIELLQLSEWPSIGIAQYPPYYIFEKDSVIIITVPKELFEHAKERDSVIKDCQSFNLRVGNKEYLYLNKGKYQWIP